MPIRPVIAGMFYRSESGALKPLIAGMAVQNGSLKPLIAGFLYQSGGGDIPVSGSGTIQGYSSAASPPDELTIAFDGAAIVEALTTGITISLNYEPSGGSEDRTFRLSTSDPGGVVWIDVSGLGTNAELAEAMADAINGQSLTDLTALEDASNVGVTSIATGADTVLGASSASVNIFISGGGSGTDLSGEVTDAEVIPASVGSFISLETAVITTNALGFESEWELYWDPDDVVLFTSTPPTDPNLTASDIFGELAETVSPLSNSLRARITGAIPDAPQQIVTIAASGILAPPGTFAEIQFPSGDEFAQSGSSDFLRLYLGSSVGSASHVFWGQAGTSTEPTGLTGTITFHEISVDGLEADEVRDAFCQAIVNTGLWTIPGFSVQTAPVNTVPPTIDNESPYEGQTITCSTGTWTMTPTSYTYQWFADAVEIVGATSNSYEVEEAVDTELTCEVTAHNAIGASDPEETSNIATVIEEPVETPFVTGQSLGTPRTDGAGYFHGMLFTVGASPITVHALGRWVNGSSSQTHEVTLTNASGAVLGTVDVDASLGSPGSYQYVALGTPVVLSALTSYAVLSEEFTGGDAFYDDNTALSTTAVATVTAGAYSAPPAGSAVSPNTLGEFSYGPVNLKYT